jgi:hypothetical protein
LNPKSPEHLSLFIDEQLRQKESKTADDTDADRMLEKSLILFRFLHSKDVFEHYYKQHLAKRLLLNRSAKDDIEKSFISKLKVTVKSFKKVFLLNFLFFLLLVGVWLSFHFETGGNDQRHVSVCLDNG